MKGTSQGSISKYSDALISFSNSLSLDNKNSNNWYYKGLCQAELGLYKQALASYTQAINNRKLVLKNLKSKS